MDVIRALFDPYGKVKGQPYWIGAIILIVFAAFVQYMSYAIISDADDIAQMMGASIWGIALWLLIYPYFCLYGKRMRDVGHTATAFLIIFLIYVVVNWVVQAAVTMPTMVGEMSTMMENMDDILGSASSGENADVNGMMNAQLEMQKSMSEKIMWPVIISGALVSAIFSFVIGTMKTDSAIK